MITTKHTTDAIRQECGMNATINPILESPIAELHDRLDHAACTAKKVLRAALALDINPNVEVDEEEYVRVTWFERELSPGVDVSVVTSWGPRSPEPSTVIATFGDWADDWFDVSHVVAALNEADSVFRQVRESVQEHRGR